MEQRKIIREVQRKTFTRIAEEFESLLSSGDMRTISVSWEMVQRKYEELEMADCEITGSLMETGGTEEQWTVELTSRDEYHKKYLTLKSQYQSLNQDEVRSVEKASICSNVSSSLGKRRFTLPRIEFKKFNGDIKEWFKFWSQFKKIHDDVDIAPEDKIEYLVQATLPNSQARLVVESFPPIGDNYQKIIESLKSRFGREDLQIEVYVRELLKLILNNALSKNMTNLSTLYDKIETQLQALETLGVTSDKCSAMVYPLIESCLPDELLRVWQRSAEFSSGNKSNLNDNSTFDNFECRLKGLMSFLKHEVENEQRISLASERFGLISESKKYHFENRNYSKQKDSIATATDLINLDTRCIFCEGSHDSERCFKAQTFSIEAKKKCISNKNACFRCLKRGHSVRKCRERLRCIVCSKPHFPIMCPEIPIRKSNFGNNSISDSNVPGNSSSTDSVPNKECVMSEQVLANYSSTHVFLQILRVKLVSKNGIRDVRVLIDSGSQRSYILKSLAQEMGYKPKSKENMVHLLFGGASSSEQIHNCYDIVLKSGSYECKFEALDQTIICRTIPSIFSGSWMNELHNLGVVVSDIQDSSPIDILIGADVAGHLYTGKIHILQCGIVAIETRLGWTLMGKIPGESPRSSTAMSVFTLLADHLSITDLWNLDVLGIIEPIEKRSREEVEQHLDFFLQTVKVDRDNRYEVRLPWIEGHPPLPSNYSLSKRRLDNTLKKLKSCNLVEEYDKVFKEWEAEGIIEEVVEEKAKGHYLPHHAVIKESSLTTKIRLVFDASSHEKGKPSLNHCIEKGPNLLEVIPLILIRFRQKQFGVVSDIRKAFLQISLNECDRDCLRFLWINEANGEKIYRHKRVVFGVNCSPFLLGACINYHLSQMLKTSKYSEASIRQLMKSFYVDNCVTSLSDYRDLQNFIEESTAIMAEGKFDLRGWEYTQNVEISEDTNEFTPLLGLTWSTKDDVISINKECLENIEDIKTQIVTKRLILSLAQKLFDPIGFTSPVSLLPKILLQRAWKQRKDWDTEVDETIGNEFLSWINELQDLLKIKIPRWISAGPFESENLSLHTFCDASQKAYATCVFLRSVKDGKVKVSLLAAKSRVAPIKTLSTPRLELLAATIGARLCDSIRSEFDPEIERYYWTDSSTVLAWIRRTDEWGVFVWNRVQEMRTLSNIDSWRHVPGILNPADLPSRGCKARALLQSRWWEGPEWLSRDSSMWPRDEVLQYDESVIEQEKKKRIVSLLLCFNSPWFQL